MTMLDGMRRHKGWLKWSLALVCLAFVFLYVPGFVDQTALEGFPNDVVATVGDREITAAQFRQMYLLQLENFRRQSSGDVSEEVLRSLGIDRQVLQGMIARSAAVAEAERLGMSVSDAEVRHRIVNLPGLQENGQFIGEARYRQVLQFQRPPMTPAQFEEELRRDILFERLQAAVTSWVAVSEDEIAEEYRRRNETVTVELVTFRADDWLEETEATDEEVAARYEEEPLAYEEPEKRQLRFLLVDESAIFESLTLTDDEVRQYYDTNISQYTTPGQVRASQILLRIEDGEEAAVEARAAELAAEARGGADFADLAREHSDDEATAADGGDLGVIEPGRLVPEVEAAAFALDVDGVSDPVRSAFGFHVLRVTEKQEETRQPLDDVREAIENILKNERATTRAEALARAIAAEVETPEDLQRAAGARGLELQESGFVGRGEPILGLGFAPQVSAEAFRIEEGDVAGPVQTPTGPAFVTVIGRQDPVVPPLEEVREDVARDVRRLKALERAREEADAVAASLADSEDFAAAAEAADLTVATSGPVARGAAFPDVGVSAALEQAAFELPVGGVSDVLEASGETLAIVRLVERSEVTSGEIADARDDLRGELLQSRRNAFYNAYMSRVEEQLGVNIDYGALDIAVGT